MSPPNVAVVVATMGRPREVEQLVDHLARQTVQPSALVLSITDDADLSERPLPGHAIVVKGPKGSCVQRNRGMAEILAKCDVVAFLDDDYLPSRRAIEGMARFFADHADVAGANGVLLADGAKTPGISYAAAVQLLADHEMEQPRIASIVSELYGLYGCNMAFRASAIGETRFDEMLPLYAWQEDIDFSMQLLPRGRLVKTDAFVGVHRGVKAARTSGVRLGYSQIANPLYLVRKGTMRRQQAMRLAIRNVLANHARFFWSEPWVDRRGRVRGNWLAIRDLLRKRISPSQILKL